MTTNISKEMSGPEKFRYGAELGALVRQLLRHPPYLEPPRKLGFFWEAKTFAAAVGNVSDNAVRQWLRGDALPGQHMPSIIRVLFGPDPAPFANEVKELQQVYERCVDLREGRGSSHQLNTDLVGSIPHLAPYYMGRHEERDALVSALLSDENVSSVLVQGGPGMGKTELTKAVARHTDIVARFAERRWFVPLETSSSAAEMKEAIARAIGGDPADGFQSALDSLHAKRTLLVLDNLETPWEKSDERQAVEAVLADLCSVDGVAILASVRGTEAIRGTRWFEHKIQAFSDSIAADLFVSICGTCILRDYYLEKFIDALGGVPLAIELVARRAHGRDTLELLWQRWLEIGSELARDSNITEDRLSSLPKSIELSLDSSRMEQHPALRLFSVLGCLPDGLTSKDCIALLGDNAFDAQERLCHVGLGIERCGRIGLLQPVREHALRRRPPQGDDALVWVDHFAAMIGRLGPSVQRGEDEGALAQFSSDFHNIESAIFKMIDQNKIGEINELMDDFSWMTVLCARVTSVFDILADRFLDELDYARHANCIKANADLALKF